MKERVLLQVASLIAIILFLGCATEPSTNPTDNGTTPSSPTPKYSFSAILLADGTGTGSIQTTTSNGSYNAGTQITVEAIVGANSTFTGWYTAEQNGELLSSNTTFSLKLTKETNIFARFDIRSITFNDNELELSIRNEIKIPSGIINYNDIKSLKSLVIPGNPSPLITQLNGIEYFNNLTYLNLNNHLIVNINQLSKLTKLERLLLERNKITNIIPIANLTNLNLLYLNNNSINDITPIKGLINLTTIQLNNNLISDLRAFNDLTKVTSLVLNNNNITSTKGLQNLKSVTYLDLSHNQISDISELQYLTNLKTIKLNSNQLKNIWPLINNTGIGEGDVVYIGGNGNFTAEQIEALKAKKVILYYP